MKANLKNFRFINEIFPYFDGEDDESNIKYPDIDDVIEKSFEAVTTTSIYLPPHGDYDNEYEEPSSSYTNDLFSAKFLEGLENDDNFLDVENKENNETIVSENTNTTQSAADVITVEHNGTGKEERKKKRKRKADKENDKHFQVKRKFGAKQKPNKI